ncbi:hypothetical protein JCM17380_43510 [Desulfosporosinus burensis]
MKFGGDTPNNTNNPNNPYDPIGPQGFPRSPNGQLGPGYSPGSIRNTLGSGLKASGFFQKDGQIQNLRGGFIGAKQPNYQGTQWQGPPPAQGMGLGFSQQSGGYPQDQGYKQGMANYQGQTRQLVLQAAQEGINGNGVATISQDNSFLLIANLPSPQMFLRQGQTGVYAAYLVDDKGKTGFLVGGLRQVGNGVYRAHFQSPVPLHHYSRVVVSLENPAQLGQAPQGPILLKVKEPMGVMSFLGPMKTTVTSVWEKVTGLFSGGKKAPLSPEVAPLSPEFLQYLNQVGLSPDTVPEIPPVPPTTPPMGQN